MNRKLVLMMTLAALMTFSTDAAAQAFEGKGSKQLLIGLGLNQHTGYFTTNGKGIQGSYNPRSGGLSLQMEFGIHEYVGLGFFAGIEGFNNYGGGSIAPGYSGYYGYYGYGVGGYKSNYYGMAIPVGFQANFHFLQLIADKTGKNFADKLDVYAGLNIGSGVMFVFANERYKNKYIKDAYDDGYIVNGRDLNDVGPMIYGGAHVGIRFYPSSNFGIFAEVGYGKTIAQGGICFKM